MANSDMRRRLAMMFEGSPEVISGVPPITTRKHKLLSLKAFGGTEQNGTPTPNNPVDIVCNNGVLKYGQYGKNLFDINTATRYKCDANGNNSIIYNFTAVSNDSKAQTYGFVVKPNTTYTISKINGNRLSIGGFTSVKIPSSTSTPCDYYYSGVKDYNSVTFTTDSDCVWILFTVKNNTDLVEDATNIQIELGSEATSYEPYHFGLHTDGTDEVISVHGKNLFDINTMLVVKKAIRAGNTSEQNPLGSELSNTLWSCTTYIKVFPNTTYTYTIPDSTVANAAGIVFYADTTVESAISGLTQKSSLTRTFTTPNNCNYLRFSWKNSHGNNGVQLELGSIATTYEPYYNGGTAIAETLLKIGNYQDVQSILDGVVTRNVGIKVFDGTESWSRGASTDASGNRVFYFNFSDKDIGNSLPMLSTHFSYKSSASYVSLVSGAFLSHASNSTVYFDGNEVTTVSDWKQWLADQYNAGTPVIVVYPLATPTTEQVAGQNLALTSGTNVIDITQASLDNLELEGKAR